MPDITPSEFFDFLSRESRRVRVLHAYADCVERSGFWLGGVLGFVVGMAVAGFLVALWEIFG